MSMLRRRGQLGFSLIELLVVLSTIALLVAILVPSLRRAREQSRLTACKKQLHNIGTGTLLYANEHDSYLPIGDQLDNPHRRLIDALASGAFVTDVENYYCPSETLKDFRYSEENAEAGRISYFYFSCEKASTNRLVSTFLRWNVKWPRLIRDHWASGTWVISDRWMSGEPTTHQFYNKGINYFSLRGGVEFVSESPRQAFE
jgi:prepilin-type N-terminal cleavage/methylation domain-containing protein